MGTWNYRVVKEIKEKGTEWSVTEVYYFDDGSIQGHSGTKYNSLNRWETKEELELTAGLIQEAFERPVLILEGDSLTEEKQPTMRDRLISGVTSGTGFDPF